MGVDESFPVTLIMALQDNSQLPAVWVDNVYKSYGRGRSKKEVLKGLFMNVQQGAMFVVFDFFKDSIS